VTDEEKRKWINPTPQYIGAVIYDEDNKRQGVAIEPGGAIWLSAREERATAEAPRDPKDNPFVAEWDEPVRRTAEGEVLETVKRQGMLILSGEPPRPITSDRFIPDRASGESAPSEPEETVTGAPPIPQTEPEVGTPSEEEVVATPEAVPANDREKQARAAAAADKPTPVNDRPQGTEAIGTPPREPAVI
jgi:hypothetical protein